MSYCSSCPSTKDNPKAPRKGVARTRPEKIGGSTDAEYVMHLAAGNSKIGWLLNFSLPPILACRSKAPCRTPNGCYDWDGYGGSLAQVRKETKIARDDNFRLMLERPDLGFEQIFREVQNQTRRDLSYGRGTYFRYHVGGDILDQNYLEWMKHVARLLPQVHFLCFTKMQNLDYRKTPKNLQIIFSMWPGWGRTMPGKRHAWLWDDRHDPRIPKDKVFLCPGSCEECGLCWRLDEIGKDVVFVKHMGGKHRISDNMSAELHAAFHAKYGSAKADKFYPLGYVYSGPRPFVPKHWKPK